MIKENVVQHNILKIFIIHFNKINENYYMFYSELTGNALFVMLLHYKLLFFTYKWITTLHFLLSNVHDNAITFLE